MKKEVILDCRRCGTVYELPSGLTVDTLSVGQALTCMNCLATIVICQRDEHGLAIRGLTPSEWRILKKINPSQHDIFMEAIKEKHGGVPELEGAKEIGFIIWQEA